MRTMTAGFALGVVMVVAACGGSASSGGTPAAGGQSASGGATASGGSAVSSGGTVTGSGGTSTAPGAFTTTLPGSDILGNLSDADFSKLCSAAQAYFTSSGFGATTGELLCRSIGVSSALGATASTDAAVQAACKSTYDSCIAGETTTAATCTKPSSSCMATVSEYEACLNDTVTEFDSALAAIPTCAQLTQANLMAALSSASALPMDPASCTAAKQKCPELSSMSGGMM